MKDVKSKSHITISNSEIKKSFSKKQDLNERSMSTICAILNTKINQKYFDFMADLRRKDKNELQTRFIK